MSSLVRVLALFGFIVGVECQSDDTELIQVAELSSEGIYSDLLGARSFDASRAGARLGAWLMPEVNHTLIKNQWGAQKPNVTYAVFTSRLEKYRAKLVSTMETWGAKPLSEDRFFAVGPRSYPVTWLKRGIVRSDCPDDPGSLACKEAAIIQEAARRGTDWVVITGEDNYVDTEKFETMLAQYNPNDALALGVYGCGGGSFCKELQPWGGFCGGGGYALSRGALYKMMQVGPDRLTEEYVKDYKGYPNDMATSCVLKKRKVQISSAKGRLVGFETMPRKQFELYLNSGFVTLHYITPEVMRWLHAKISNLEESVVKDFEAKAFDDHGCCTGCTTSPSPEGKQKQIEQCHDVMARYAAMGRE